MSEGRPSDIYAETVAVFDQGDRYEPLTTPEVAAELDANRRTVYKRLRTLADRGAVETKAVGANARVWWRRPTADEGRTGDPGSDGPTTAEREAQERRLRDARQFNEELVENAPFGMFRLDENLRITYENPRAEEIIGLPEGNEHSDAIGADIRELPSIVETGQADLFTRLQDGETIEFDFPFESIYGKTAYFTGRAVPVYRDGEFDGAILMAIDISERRQYERELERQREQLAALDELNDVVRGITEAVIEQSTRAEIEQVACDRLAASDSYHGAWIGAVDSGPGMEPRVEAGVEGYLDGLPLTADGEVPEDGLLGEAVRTAEVQLVRNTDDDATEGVAGDAPNVGYGSVAVIPVVNRGKVYDVLGVCSERPDAFAEKEREVIGQLGDVIGHAITAVDRKRALMSDEVVELGVRIPELVDCPASVDGAVTIDHMTPVGGDEYLVYGTASGDAMEMIHTLSDERPGWTDLRTFDGRDGRSRFEQRLTDPTIISIVADFGGTVDRGTIVDGEYDGTIQFPPGTNVRRIVERIREVYPNVQIVSQRQVARERPSTTRRVPKALAERLTERQRMALEAGYFQGYFQWPRQRSGEDVAETLGIGASTFHQHIRKAERKLLDIVFDER